MTTEHTSESFEQWKKGISRKLDYLINELAEEEKVKLDFSIESLNLVEKWLLKNFDVARDLREDEELLDILSIYVGETYMKHIGGKWFIDFENEKSIYYKRIVMKYDDQDIQYRSAIALCTTSISRKKGTLLSDTLKKSMEQGG